jgi:hypothetical protein
MECSGDSAETIYYRLIPEQKAAYNQEQEQARRTMETRSRHPNTGFNPASHYSTQQRDLAGTVVHPQELLHFDNYPNYQPVEGASTSQLQPNRREGTRSPTYHPDPHIKYNRDTGSPIYHADTPPPKTIEDIKKDLQDIDVDELSSVRKIFEQRNNRQDEHSKHYKLLITACDVLLKHTEGKAEDKHVIPAVVGLLTTLSKIKDDISQRFVDEIQTWIHPTTLDDLKEFILHPKADDTMKVSQQQQASTSQFHPSQSRESIVPSNKDKGRGQAPDYSHQNTQMQRSFQQSGSHRKKQLDPRVAGPSQTHSLGERSKERVPSNSDITQRQQLSSPTDTDLHTITRLTNQYVDRARAILAGATHQDLGRKPEITDKQFSLIDFIPV